MRGIHALQTLTTLSIWHPPKILGILEHPCKIWVNSLLFNATSNNLCERFSPYMFMYPSYTTSKFSDNKSKIYIDLVWVCSYNLDKDQWSKITPRTWRIKRTNESSHGEGNQWFIWCTMIWLILDHWSWCISSSSRSKVPLK